MLSLATLFYEINLTRLFAVSQFYHFAFMIVSIALLGYGASGSALSIFPQFKAAPTRLVLAWASLGAAFSILGSYLLVNWLPFDSFSIAWDPRQVAVLALHFLALATPFFFCGLAVGLLLALSPEQAGCTYAANLGGSAAGCLAALLVPAYLGGEGSVALAAVICAAAGLLNLTLRDRQADRTRLDQAGRAPENSTATGEKARRFSLTSHLVPSIAALALLIAGTAEVSARLEGNSLFPALELRLSPYKSLSYALQYPGAEVIFQRWNSISRVDLVRSAGIRSYPGMSFTYTQALPPEDALFIDGDDLSPVLQPGESLDFTRALPSRLAFELRPAARALILEPRGGLDILTALASGAQSVSAVDANPLVFEAAAATYVLPNVIPIARSGRSFSRATIQKFDIVLLSLVNSFHPVRSGAYSLAEDYRYTVEAFQDYIQLLKPGGILAFTRWMQASPSESLRAFATAVAALEARGGAPEEQIAAFRGYNAITFLVKNGPFTTDELAQIRDFSERLSFDLVFLPSLQIEDANRYSIQPEPQDYLAFKALVEAKDRKAFFRDYPYAVEPTTDDRPFFGHFFRWSQAPEVLAELGKTWQPFGGAGYFVLLALLLIATALAGLVILLPVAVFQVRRKRGAGQGLPGARLALRYPLYFGLLGLAFLLVEIPLIQSFILYLDSPAYAFAVVVFSLLAASGIGSLLSQRLPLPAGLGIIAVYLVVLQAARPWLMEMTLGWSVGWRAALVILLLTPLGICMGTAFPGGLRWMVRQPANQDWVPWIWGVNGAASVMSAILAALLALSFGFSVALKLGMFCYLAAWLLITASERRLPAGFLPR